MKDAARRDRCRPDDQRKDAQDDGRRKPMERKAKTGDGGRHGGDEKEHRPAIHPFRSEQPAENDKAGKNSNQTQDHMHYGKGVHPGIIALRFCRCR